MQDVRADEAPRFAQEAFSPSLDELLSLEDERAFRIVHERDGNTEEAMAILNGLFLRSEDAQWHVRNSILFHALECALELRWEDQVREIGTAIIECARNAPSPEFIARDMNEWLRSFIKHD